VAARPGIISGTLLLAESAPQSSSARPSRAYLEGSLKSLVPANSVRLPPPGRRMTGFAHANPELPASSR